MNFKRVLASVLSTAMLCSMTLTAIPAHAVDETLADKIAAAKSGDTIALDKDYTEAIVIPEGKKITLDLKGHTLTADANRVVTNNGNLTITDSAGGGRIERTAAGDTTGVLNETAGVLTVKSGVIDITSSNGQSVGIDNKGRIAEISGGDILSKTPSTTTDIYGVRNRPNAVIDLISGGYIYCGITAFNKNAVNAAAIGSGEKDIGDGVISSITGGLFVGEVRTGGNGYGIRSYGQVSSVTGGAFLGSNPDNAVKQETGTINYDIDYGLAPEQDGVRVVLHKSHHYVALRNENEDPIAVYTFDRNGELVQSYGHPAGSYQVYQSDVYQGDTIATLSEADLADFTENTILTVKTSNQPVFYFLGSSVTYGSNNYGNSFADYLEDDYPITVVKRAVSGTTLVNKDSGSYVARMLNQISKNVPMDHLVVQLSTNDANQNQPLGALSDSYELEDLDPTTIIGAMEYIIAYARQTWDADVTFWPGPYWNNDLYRKMYNALFDIQAKWNIGILDYYIRGSMASDAIASDNVHPLEKGYREMTPIAWEYFKDFDRNQLQTPEYKADYKKYNDQANTDGGRMVYMDFEDGTANDSQNRLTPIAGDKVTLNAEGKNGKGVSFVKDRDIGGMLRWKQDEYDPLLYADKGATISMWINPESVTGNGVLFNYGFWGFRFIMAKDGDNLLVSARSHDNNTSEFRVPGFSDLIGKGWSLVTLTCDQNRNYTVYFNGKKAGSQTLTYSLYDIARDGSSTPKRNTADEDNQYYGYYAINGAPYWRNDRDNCMAGTVDDFAIYNRALTDVEVAQLADPSITADQQKIKDAVALIAKLAAYTDTFEADRAAAQAAYDALNVVEKAAVTNLELLEQADTTAFNGKLEKNGGKYVSIDFEDGTAGDMEDRITPIVGSQVSIVEEGKYGQKSAKFTNTKSRDSIIRWKQDEYDPLLYSKDGATISMWVNLESIEGNSVLFNYGFWGYRFILQADGNNSKLRIGARNYDSTTSEFSVDGLGSKVIGKGWSLITVTCDENKHYSVYFNGELAGEKTLNFSIYDIAAEGAKTTKRNHSNETDNYYGYYSIGGANYWSGNANMVGSVDDFVLYNRALSPAEITALYQNETPVKPVEPTAAEKIEQAIDAIGTVDYSVACGERIEAARAAYDAADADVQKDVSNLAVLTKAEADYAAIFKGVRKVDNALEVTSIAGPGSGNERFDKMFDGKLNTKFGNSNHTAPIIFSVAKPVTARYYSFTTGTDSGQWTGRNPKNWTLYGSNNYDAHRGTGDWTVIDAVTDNSDLPDANCVEVRFAVDTPVAYSSYKLEFPNHNTWLQLTEINLYADIEPADYAAVDAAIAKIPKDLSIYTDESVAALNEAVDAVVRDLLITEQETVDGYAAAIEKAISRLNLKGGADYSKVDEAITKAEALDPNNYKDFSAVTAAVEAVVRGKPQTEQSVVDGYATAIEQALAKLEFKDADYSKVDEALAKVEGLEPSNYEDFSAVTAAVGAVVRGKNITEQAAVDAMATAIEEAIAKLELKPADYTAVDAALAKVPADLSSYTDESVAALNKAVNAVVRDLPITEQKTVDDYAAAIEKAVSRLNLKGGADYSKVDEALAIFDTLNPDDYEDFSDVLAAVDAVVRGMAANEQADVDAMAKAIEDAIANLKPKSDIVPGDMNKDGKVTIQDVMEACKVLARQSAGKAPTEDEMKRGDLDGDDKFTITDVMEICKILARQA
ncbi:MAG: hypothetical protein HFE86_07745 [Clostridiales bacterium]|nr:hypothetical protein [Clostridiales bacterium]